MNRKEFYNYILENYNISGEAGRLIDNILRFIEKEPNMVQQIRMAIELLDGTIGLELDEIRMIKF